MPFASPAGHPAGPYYRMKIRLGKFRVSTLSAQSAFSVPPEIPTLVRTDEQRGADLLFAWRFLLFALF
jgi:hypothetical protein